jgi:hypothetical protein
VVLFVQATMPEDLTRWTIRLALAVYVAVLVLRIRAKTASAERASTPANPCLTDPARRDLRLRWLWTLGCLLLWAHVASAFAFYHHWSHDDAYMRTARETADTVGIDWGGGIYFNYLFMLLWTFDVAWWWTLPAAHQNRSRMYSVFLDAYLAFIAFNATVVFGNGAVRYFGIAATLGLVWLAWSSRHGGHLQPG